MTLCRPSSLLFALCLLGATLAQTKDAHAQTPPCSAAGYNDFDFWLGDWEVRQPDGTLAGTNVISKEEGNCLIIERWRGADGTTGQSYNYFNPASNRWRQLWVSQGAIIDYEGSLVAAGKMQLQGRIVYQADGREADFRGTWTRRTDGSVLQEFVEKDAESGEWNVWFTGLYTQAKPQQTP
ncbi:MAG: hypothetical protein AAF515_15320 [Pseudomonadota bacterium]